MYSAQGEVSCLQSVFPIPFSVVCQSYSSHIAHTQKLSCNVTLRATPPNPATGPAVGCEKRSAFPVYLDERMCRAGRMLEILRVAAATDWGCALWSVNLLDVGKPPHDEWAPPHDAATEMEDGLFGVRGTLDSFPSLVCEHCARTHQTDTTVHKYLFHPDGIRMCPPELDIRHDLMKIPSWTFDGVRIGRILEPLVTPTEFRRAMAANVKTLCFDDTEFMDRSLNE